MTIAKHDFDTLTALIKERSGITLSSDKEYLIEGRLLPVAKKHGFDDLHGMAQSLNGLKKESLIIDIVEAMTTNESFFFRDIKPFDQLSKIIIPDMLAANPSMQKIRIWSAACSSGQEPYSIIMTLLDIPQCASMNISVIATDLDEQILNKAREGVYSQFEVQRGVPVAKLLKCFKQEGEKWRIKSDISKYVEFRQFNLMNDPASLGSFDLVFCRNVLIYFDIPIKQKVMNGLRKAMLPHASLFLGSSESVMSLETDLELYRETTGVFRPKRLK